ncbi:MAG: DoxX family membrane protein [Crocinitomicaceae bacterium]|nr:DoxX family membrane protein [Crocinitomicaceae bacterium]
MNEMFRSIHSAAVGNTTLYFRCILFLTFLGHGFASLHLSAPGYELHHRIFESVNFFQWNVETALTLIGWWDILLAAGIILGILPRIFLSFALIYLITVAVVGCLYYYAKTDSIFGFAESFRRFAWIFYVIFLWIFYNNRNKIFGLLRIGIGFAFLAHGLASIGFFGLKGAHIELAQQFFSENIANNIVYYSGFSDTAFGLLIILGIFSRPLAIFGSLWLVFVVILSFMVGIPEGIFRCGFLFSCIYVAMDKRCHTVIWKKGVIEKELLA